MPFDPAYPERRKHTTCGEKPIPTCDGPAQATRRCKEEAEKRVYRGVLRLGGCLRVLITRRRSAGETSLELTHERLHVRVRLSRLGIASHELGKDAHEHFLEVLHAFVVQISTDETHDERSLVFLLLCLLHGFLDLTSVDFVLHFFLLLTVRIGILH